MSSYLVSPWSPPFHELIPKAHASISTTDGILNETPKALRFDIKESAALFRELFQNQHSHIQHEWQVELKRPTRKPAVLLQEKGTMYVTENEVAAIIPILLGDAKKGKVKIGDLCQDIEPDTVIWLKGHVCFEMSDDVPYGLALYPTSPLKAIEPQLEH